MAWVKRLLATVVLGTVSILSAELTARLDDIIRDGIPFLAAPDQQRDLTVRDSLGVRGRPNGRHRSWKLNGAGFRGPEISEDPPIGCRRVMVLGASESFGYYEPPGKEYPAQLQDSLRASGCHEVVNAAIVGITLPQIVTLWRNWASRFHPDLVLIYATPMFYLSDNPPFFRRRAGESVGPDPRWWRPRLLVRAKQRFEYPAFIQRRRVAGTLRRASTGKPPDWAFDSIPSERLALLGAHLDTLLTAIAVTGATPVVVTHPSRFGPGLNREDQDMLEGWRSFSPRATEKTMLAFEARSADLMRSIGSREHIPVIDLAQRMTGHREWFADFAHFTEEGAAVAAGITAETIRRLPYGPLVDKIRGRSDSAPPVQVWPCSRGSGS